MNTQNQSIQTIRKYLGITIIELAKAIYRNDSYIKNRLCASNCMNEKDLKFTDKEFLKIYDVLKTKMNIIKGNLSNLNGLLDSELNEVVK